MGIEICIKRVYDDYDVRDGTAILVDRLWPRGVRKHNPNVDIWIKDIAPTNELRKWYSHNPKKWVDFKRKYIKELRANPALERVMDIVLSSQKTTLMYASKDLKHNNAIVLRNFLAKRLNIRR